MDLTVTFRNTVNPSKYRYMAIFSSQQTPKLPIPLPQDYLPTPGSTYLLANIIALHPTETLAYYYTHYFSTWSDYLVLSGSEIAFFKSNNSGFNTPVDGNNLIYIQEIGFQQSVSSVNGKEWRLVIPLQILSALSDTLYLNIAVCEIRDPGQASGYVIDTLRSSFPVISYVYGRQDQLQDVTELSIDGSADIVSWRVRLY